MRVEEKAGEFMARKVIELAQTREDLCDESGLGFWPIPAMFPQVLSHTIHLLQRKITNLILEGKTQEAHLLTHVRCDLLKIVHEGDLGENHTGIFLHEHRRALEIDRTTLEKLPFYSFCTSLLEIDNPLVLLGAITRNEEGSIGEAKALVKTNLIKNRKFAELHLIEEVEHGRISAQIKSLLVDHPIFGSDFTQGLKLHDQLYSKILDTTHNGKLTPSELKELNSLAQGDHKKFAELIKNRENGMPMAYLRGDIKFYGREFSVDSRTYVPNRETEFLAKSFLEILEEGDTVLDVGTGCGSLAITIQKERPGVKVYGSDIDKNALDVANKNATTHKVDIKFFEGSYVDNPEIPEPDYIIADLPYGTPDIILHEGGMRELEYMPQVSLFHPSGALGAQVELLKSIMKRGWKPVIFIETGFLKKEEVAKIIPVTATWEFRKQGGYSITIISLK
jgi:release factor glutamine methyltransferase